MARNNHNKGMAFTRNGINKNQPKMASNAMAFTYYSMQQTLKHELLLNVASQYT